MIPIRTYIIAGASIFTLGYCSGHGCQSTTPSSPSAVTTSTPSLEQIVVQPAAPLVPSPPPRLLTPQERLLKLLASNPSLLPSSPQPTLYHHRSSTGFFGHCKHFLHGAVRFGREVYQEMTNEVDQCYLEAKEKLEHISGGK